MPIVDRRTNLIPANTRNSDVAQKLVEHVASMQQQKSIAAFRVQGFRAIHYKALDNGTLCTCKTQNTVASNLSPDGKAPTGAINRIISGDSSFGISKYNSNSDSINATTNNMNRIGDGDDEFNNSEFDTTLGDDGQFVGDIDLQTMLSEIDLGSLGIRDVSCPICFGSGFIGGYSVFRGWREVIVPTMMKTTSYLDLPSYKLSKGEHLFNLTLPAHSTNDISFRVFNGRESADALLFIKSGSDFLLAKNLRKFFDGREHEFKVVAESTITHVEFQAMMSDESIYFEFPKLTYSSDISMLEQQEPFQIIVSPDSPVLSTLDVIAECQLGKILVVQNVNPWNTRNRQMLGTEVQVRVAQPQELWYILPFLGITGQKRTQAIRKSDSIQSSGVVSGKTLDLSGRY